MTITRHDWTEQGSLSHQRETDLADEIERSGVPTVRVIAPVAVGKTALATEISEHMSMLGFDVDLYDLEGDPFADDPETQAHRLANIAPRVKVAVCTIQTRRPLRPLPEPFAEPEPAPGEDCYSVLAAVIDKFSGWPTSIDELLGEELYHRVQRALGYED